MSAFQHLINLIEPFPPLEWLISASIPNWLLGSEKPFQLANHLSTYPLFPFGRIKIKLVLWHIGIGSLTYVASCNGLIAVQISSEASRLPRGAPHYSACPMLGFWPHTPSPFSRYTRPRVRSPDVPQGYQSNSQRKPQRFLPNYCIPFVWPSLLRLPRVATAFIFKHHRSLS
jgi:hypothetical protein